MWIGGMKHRITIEHLVVTQDDYGGQVKTWETFTTRWARVMPQSGRQFFESSKETSELLTEIRMRYVPGVTTTMRVLVGGNTYDIVAALNQEQRNRALTLMCREVV